MIRTNVVKLTSMQAVAYRQKLSAGGSGIVILKKGVSQPGIASISNSSGEAIPTANSPLGEYPIKKIVEMLDEVYNKGVFRELKAEIRSKLSKSKK